MNTLFAQIAALFALLCSFWGVLWSLGTRDRLRILKILRHVEEILMENGDCFGKEGKKKKDG